MQYHQQICIMYRHTVSPLHSCVIPAGWGPPALPVHMKTRDVFLQSGIALDLFWHMLIFHWIPVNHLLSPTDIFKIFIRCIASVFEEHILTKSDFFLWCPW